MAAEDERLKVLVPGVPALAWLVFLVERIAERLSSVVLATAWYDEDEVTNVELAAFELEVVLTANGGVGMEDEVLNASDAVVVASTVVLEVVP